MLRARKGCCPSTEERASPRLEQRRPPGKGDVKDCWKQAGERKMYWKVEGQDAERSGWMVIRGLECLAKALGL